MKTYKITWYETVHNYYQTEIKANSAEEAKRIIDEDVNEARTGVTEETHAEVQEWEILTVNEK